MVAITLYAKQKKRHRCTEIDNFYWCSKTSLCLSIHPHLTHLPVLSQHHWIFSDSQIYLTFILHCMEKEMATHSSILAWSTRWTEGPGGL